MSSFYMTARHKETGEILEVACLNHYFGRRRHGYELTNGHVMNEDNFQKQFERVEKVQYTQLSECKRLLAIESRDHMASKLMRKEADNLIEELVETLEWLKMNNHALTNAVLQSAEAYLKGKKQ